MPWRPALVLAASAAALVPLPATFVERVYSRRLYLGGGCTFLLTGTLGLVLAPGGAWAWATLAGLATGVCFPLVMTLPVDVGRGPAQTGAIAAMMLGAGYVLSGLAPLVLGAIRDATGSFDAVLWVLFGAAAAMFALCLSLSQTRLGRSGLPEPAPVP